MERVSAPKKPISIWWWAFGYFAAYIPYTVLTKLLTSSKGLIDTGHGPVGSFDPAWEGALAQALRECAGEISRRLGPNP